MANVIDSFKSAGPLGIAVFILAFVANFFNWIAFTTASWARAFAFPVTRSNVYIGYGLWRICASGEGLVGSCQMVDGTNIPHYGATQALVSIGFLGINIMCLIIFLKMFTGMCSSVGDIDKVNAIQAIVTGVIYLIGIIIFGAAYGDGKKTHNEGNNRDGDLGYSFVLAVLAMILEIVVGVLLLVMGIKGGSVGSK